MPLALPRAMQMRLCLLGLLVATTAHAGRRTPGVTEDDLIPKSEIRDSVEAGALMPWTLPARHVRQGMLINGYGGFDLAKDAPVMSGALHATLIERLTLRATATNTGMSDQVDPGVGLLFDVLRQEDAGLDVAFGGDYELAGWNRHESIVTRVAAGATAGVTRMQANAAFGMATGGDGRYGDLRLSGLHPVAQGVYAGIDSRARVDLMPEDNDETSGELDWDMQAGPVATVAVGRFSVSATGGVSAWKQRSHERSHVGAVGAVGVGAVF